MSILSIINEKELLNLWNMIFNIALNMLHDERDAEDATQDIFTKLIENYHKFKNQSKFETWAYRIAYNHLIDYKKKHFNDNISFESFEQESKNFIPYNNELELTLEEEKIYAEEIKIGCTMAMLQCLDATNRFVCILGNIFAFDSKLASEICEISEDSYRQKLSRSRKKISNFMNNNCGLVNKNAYCKCKKRIKIAYDHGRIHPKNVIKKDKTIKDCFKEMNEIDEISKIFRDNPYINKKELFYSLMKGKFKILMTNTFSTN